MELVEHILYNLLSCKEMTINAFELLGIYQLPFGSTSLQKTFFKFEILDEKFEVRAFSMYPKFGTGRDGKYKNIKTFPEIPPKTTIFPQVVFTSTTSSEFFPIITITFNDGDYKSRDRFYQVFNNKEP